ncbi:MAG TPA: pyrroline-5-carboxylate reductase [Gammaproteobacteria bacterium]|nr:pyrroline-5-carboxylate reductase [Gammaproteobacteria bacterium]
MNHQIGFIGGGNMAQAIVAGLLNSGYSSSNIHVSDPNPACRSAVSALGVSCFEESGPVVTQADLIILAVKPQIVDAVLAQLSPTLQGTQVIISIAAGITIGSIRQQLNNAPNAIVRVMPNTPALIGQGISALASDSPLDRITKAAVQEIFDSCGKTLWLGGEDEMDTVTAVSGSGPAYFFLMIENLINTGARLGLAPEVARELVVQTAKGAAEMVEFSDVGPDVLRQRVTSPGGTTEAALGVFNDGDFSDLVDRALVAARDRAGELSEDAPKNLR